MRKKLVNILKDLMRKNEYIEFLVGRNGEFDIFASSVVKRTQKDFNDDNSALVWVLPYFTSDYRKNEKYYEEYYDSIEVCEESQNAYFKSSITIRNKSMVRRSDLIICYITKESGGAYNTIKYANFLNKQIINLANLE